MALPDLGPPASVQMLRILLLLVEAAADPNAQVFGNVRITAITERLWRFEHSAASPPAFVDEPTVTVGKLPCGTSACGAAGRPSVPVKVEKPSGDEVRLSTAAVTVSYRVGMPFSAASLRAADSQNRSWAYGDLDDGNLFGTARTLDSHAEALNLNCSERVSKTMPNVEEHCSFGLISTKGWAVLNDTGSPIW